MKIFFFLVYEITTENSQVFNQGTRYRGPLQATYSLDIILA